MLRSESRSTTSTSCSPSQNEECTFSKGLSSHTEPRMIRAALRVALLLGALSFVAACSAPASEDVDSADESILGGRAAKGIYPAVGYLAVRTEDYPFCTATLVADQFIVTAGHCIKG